MNDPTSVPPPLPPAGRNDPAPHRRPPPRPTYGGGFSPSAPVLGLVALVGFATIFLALGQSDIDVPPVLRFGRAIGTGVAVFMLAWLAGWIGWFAAGRRRWAGIVLMILAAFGLGTWQSALGIGAERDRALRAEAWTAVEATTGRVQRAAGLDAKDLAAVDVEVRQAMRPLDELLERDEVLAADLEPFLSRSRAMLSARLECELQAVIVRADVSDRQGDLTRFAAHADMEALRDALARMSVNAQECADNLELWPAQMRELAAMGAVGRRETAELESTASTIEAELIPANQRLVRAIVAFVAAEDALLDMLDDSRNQWTVAANGRAFEFRRESTLAEFERHRLTLQAAEVELRSAVFGVVRVGNRRGF